MLTFGRVVRTMWAIREQHRIFDGVVLEGLVVRLEIRD
jgi:hypothetical protein